MSPRFNEISVTYDPFHHRDYPMDGNGSPSLLKRILREDLFHIKQNFGKIRTYYSTYHGADIVPIAAEAGLKVFLGVFMYGNDHADWREAEIKSAIRSARRYPNTVCGILVGNENLELDDVEPNEGTDLFTPDEIGAVIDRIRRAGVSVPIGTSQRYNDWLSNDSDLKELADKCTLIGVNVYPFYSPGGNNPMETLTNQWNYLLSHYSRRSRFCITETGWPTNGSPPTQYPRSVPSKDNAETYFNGVRNWARTNSTWDVYVFKYFDRRPDDEYLEGKPMYEQYFGLCSKDGSPKFL